MIMYTGDWWQSYSRTHIASIVVWNDGSLLPHIDCLTLFLLHFLYSKYLKSDESIISSTRQGLIIYCSQIYHQIPTQSLFLTPQPNIKSRMALYQSEQTIIPQITSEFQYQWHLWRSYCLSSHKLPCFPPPPQCLDSAILKWFIANLMSQIWS